MTVRPIRPEEFLREHCVEFEPQNHNYTGPIQNQCTENESGACTTQEGKILAGLAAKLGGPVLEIGGDNGVSTRYIHEGLDLRGDDGPTGIVHSVDIHHLWEEDLNWPRRRRHCLDSAKILTVPELVNANCKWAWIDGDHRFGPVWRDAETCVRLGIRHLIFHDVAPHIQQVRSVHNSDGSQARAAVLGFFSEHATELLEVLTRTGLMYVHLEE